jgi:hypothetical protein
MIRRLRPGRNPLRRTADRVEAAVMATLLVVFLAAVPLAALAPAGWAAAAVAGTGFLARRVLDRRRLAAWDADW